MAKTAGGHSSVELLPGQARTGLTLELRPTAAGVHHPGNENLLDIGADAGDAEREHIHREAGIDAGSHHGDAAVSGQLTDPSAESRITLKRIEQLLR